MGLGRTGIEEGGVVPSFDAFDETLPFPGLDEKDRDDK